MFDQDDDLENITLHLLEELGLELNPDNERVAREALREAFRIGTVHGWNEKADTNKYFGNCS